MSGTLLVVDLALAGAILVVAPAFGLRRSHAWSCALAALATARLVVSGLLLLTSGLLPADTRPTVQMPLAVLPVAWALWRPSRAAAHVAAAGALLSVWWLLVPFDPGGSAFVLAGSVVVLAVIAGLSEVADHRRATGSRLATARPGWRRSSGRWAGRSRCTRWCGVRRERGSGGGRGVLPAGRNVVHRSSRSWLPWVSSER